MKKLLAIAGIVFVVALCSSRARAIISTVSGTLSGTASNVFSPPLSPANGGVGVMTGAPMWGRFYGTGADGAGPASGALACGESDFTSWAATGNITPAAGCSVIVRSQGAVTFSAAAAITASGINGNVGNLGGAGGSGGGGAASSAASVATTWFNPGNAAVGAAQVLSSAAALSAVAGNDGGVIGTNLAELAFSTGPPFRCVGGGIGTAGGSSGGAAGAGGSCIVIIAPSITLGAGTIINASGAPGVAPTANSTGAGGGGGGGIIWFLSQTFTDSGAIYKYGGGPGGAITAPSVQVTGGGCDTTGCGTDAVITVTALVGGGLSAANMTLTNAGTGYKTAPDCKVNAGASGLTGSPACHFAAPIAGAIALPIIDTAGSGGTLTTFTTTFVGGYGANGFYRQQLIQ